MGNSGSSAIKSGVLPPKSGILPVGKHGNHLYSGKGFVMKFNING